MIEYTKTRFRRPGRGIMLAIALVLGPVHEHPAEARVEVSVTQIGFPTLRSGNVVRSGQWVPVTVDLALVEQSSFDGSVRVAQLDSDGDECYDSVDVHLRIETGGVQRVRLYVPTNTARGKGLLACELLDAQGDAVEVLTGGQLAYRAHYPEPPVTIPDDDILILSLSKGTIGRIRDLVEPDQLEVLLRRPHVAHMSPLDLPEHWIGLESLDYIVWDDAQPEELTLRQLHALIEWARQGGTLFIAASRSAGAIKLAKQLDAVMPVDLGQTTPVNNLRYLREQLLDAADDEQRLRGSTHTWLDTGFEPAIPIVQCTPRSGTVRIPNRADNDSTVLTRRRLGRGHIIFSAVVLKDLFTAPGGASKFFRKVLHLRRVANKDDTPPSRIPLFNNVISAVSFSTKAGVYLFIAGVSATGYVLLATFGTWAILGGKGRRRHSWTAFAITAVAASVVTVIVVKSLQGFGESLHQISIIDADAGSSIGMGTAFFGLKTSSDTRLDVWLPSNALGATEPASTDCFLRPIPDSSDWQATATSFADPKAYRLIPAAALIENVPIRATLKQFEGRWRGKMGGKLTGEIKLSGRRISDDSYLVNDLGVDLDPCYLIHSLLDLESYDGARDAGIFVYDIGPLRGDGLRTSLASRCYRPGADETIDDAINRSTLALQQGVWARKFTGLLSDFGLASSVSGGTLGEERAALLLLSTLGDFDPATMPSQPAHLRVARTFSRSHARQFDLREHIQPGKLDDNGKALNTGNAVLIGFAQDPGPIRLFKREGTRGFTSLEPDRKKSWTMYRIHIPTEHARAGRTLRTGVGSETEEQ